jgi:hypothetical protein
VAAEITRRQAGRLELEEAEASERSWGSGRASGDGLRTAIAATHILTAGGVGPWATICERVDSATGCLVCQDGACGSEIFSKRTTGFAQMMAKSQLFQINLKGSSGLRDCATLFLHSDRWSLPLLLFPL